MAEQSLKEKTAKGLFWGGLSNGVQQLLNLFFGIFLSRILNAEDYGSSLWFRPSARMISITFTLNSALYLRFGVSVKAGGGLKS